MPNRHDGRKGPTFTVSDEKGKYRGWWSQRESNPRYRRERPVS
jgi:hypothetical protein